MKNLSLVKIPAKTTGSGRRHWVAINITQQDIKRGANARHPGLHLMAGYWYGKGQGHKTRKAYGKLIELPKNSKVIGYARTSFLIRKLVN